MQRAFHTKAKISPDQKIEIQDLDLPVGETVDVFVVVSEEDKKEPLAILDFIDQLPGQRQFKTVAEVDQYLREERDSWDS